MNVKSSTSAQKESKTLTLRMQPDVHELIERAARANEQSLNQFIADAAKEAARTEPVGGRTQVKLAILVDLDSFGGRPTINIDALELAATALGRPVVRCSYSTAGAVDLSPSRQSLLARNYSHEMLPNRDALRLRLAIEATKINADGAVRNFVIVTADEALGWVSQQLMRQGASVTGVGLRSDLETGPDFIRAFENFQYYDRIDCPPESDELRQMRESYIDILIQATLKLENRGAKTVGAALIPLIKDRQPAASPELLEIGNWKELAELARDQGLVEEIESSGADFLLKLTKNGRARASALLEKAEAASIHRGEIARIRDAIAEILKIELPDVASRFLAFNAVQWVVNEEMTQDGISLVDLSYRVAARLGPTGVQQNTVYRLLYGLYRGGAFEFGPNPANENDPNILRVRIPVLHFDDAFVLNLMRIPKKFPAHSSPTDLSLAIYGTTSQEKKIASMLRLAVDPSFDRAQLPSYLTKLGTNSMQS